ncbi:Nucleoside-diphosphate-sugar epimerase [Pseudorhodobacter antarcticus]|jgi:nucleoside-diphosphate-sugar epimerase|uniref:Nucleoside-diphosphate-sugar epimerase n=1 Tax=Pseudorhodobacter antarcticus TaxID=1077947 RepID=A0A1H8EAP8_9RHOB|nr:D-erythronate dehydrogenase [Pseudorhodobacter antarcticus]SEN15907.1 Nucleoside-diphosphate-sugar epimerase [Pseudorhodobacter antarcticus]
MRVLITGGGGFLGQKLARALGTTGQLRGQPITQLTLADLAAPAPLTLPFPATNTACNITDPADVQTLMAQPFDVIFHLAAIVSGQAEADFDLGLNVNLFGTLNLLQAARTHANAPVVVYASSIAAHGGEEPAHIVDGVELNPQTSYGTQKVMGELLLNDMTRRGMVDGRGLRLPTVTIRPGRANAAASSFMSSIFRDTLQGETSNCPVAPDYPIYHTAPRTVVANLIHAANLNCADFGTNRCINLPGRSDTVAQMIAAMTDVTGPDAENRITWHPDAAVQTIVKGWRGHCTPTKALALGFAQDASFADTVRWFLADDIAKAP